MGAVCTLGRPSVRLRRLGGRFWPPPRSPMGLAFRVEEIEDLYMKPAIQKHKPTAGALRAAKAIQEDASLLNSLPELIDRETGVREAFEILEAIIAQAGDLIESRSPELVAEARAVLRRYSDEAARQVE